MEAPRPYVPAGWYDNPDQRGEHRWWNGSAWTDAVRPAVAMVERTEEAARRAAPRRERSDEWRMAETAFVFGWISCIHGSTTGAYDYRIGAVGLAVALVTGLPGIYLGLVNRKPLRIALGLIGFGLALVNLVWVVHRASGLFS